MDNFEIRFFADDAAVYRVGEGLLDRTLPRAEWTHEAHLAATYWIIRERPDIAAENDMPAIISAYNVAVGGVNDDSQGYHETITQIYIAAIRHHLARRRNGEAIVAGVNALLASPLGRRDLPLHFFSKERLFSVDARRKFIAPDRLALSHLPTLV